MMKRKITIFTYLLLFVHVVTADYPLISYTIKSRDPLYSQHQQDIELWYSDRAKSQPLMIFRYIPLPSEDIFSVAAAFNVPYDTLATLNNWNAPDLLKAGDEVLIPNIPGVFVPIVPEDEWEKNLSEITRSSDAIQVIIRLEDNKNRMFRFYPGDKFSSDERISFLGSSFSLPVRQGNITSSFGYRSHPLTGELSFHPGIDIRTPVGTPVFAARNGIVHDIGTLKVHGLYVIINHDGGYQTVYAHLDGVPVKVGQSVGAGEQIASSGNSGLSTGPHLHFEIRKNGKPTNPATLTAFHELK